MRSISPNAPGDWARIIAKRCRFSSKLGASGPTAASCCSSTEGKGRSVRRDMVQLLFTHPVALKLLCCLAPKDIETALFQHAVSPAEHWPGNAGRIAVADDQGQTVRARKD